MSAGAAGAPLRGALRRQARFFAGRFGFAAAVLFPAAALSKSPITPLSGHTENAGHFLQPAASAIGQSVMGGFLASGTGGQHTGGAPVFAARMRRPLHGPAAFPTPPAAAA